jgi:putative tryptophan/tyrosine transport system substrate-binding protein
MEHSPTSATGVGVGADALTASLCEEYPVALVADHRADHVRGIGRFGLIVMAEASFFPHRNRICEFALKHRLPAIYTFRLFVDAGGLMSYSYNLPEQWQRAATYVDKILKGAKPGDLPVEQPTKFELVINLKTAKALGLTIPQSLLVRADEIIQ